ncbi:MAG: pilus assembly PilX N-terminal domain-containing protein [Syntrophobacterales bacterium]|nr:pilus assembly PilX N-terminal domain-containing protein [Syntrophobacterales bacterium]
MTEISKDERGMVLVIILCIIAILIMLGSSNVMTSMTDLRISSNYRLSTQAFYVAEAGAEYGYTKLREELQVLNPTIGNITTPTLGGYTFDTFSVAAVGTQSAGVMGGAYEGLTAYITDYLVTSAARVSGTNASARVELLVKDNLIPIFQFGIFFEGNLEILPGTNMTFTSAVPNGGRIHSNKNIYLNADGSSTTLSIDTRITSAGHIIKGHLDGRSHTDGTVRIKDQNGNYQNMAVDSSDPNWTGTAMSRWGGRVQDSAMGVNALNVPVGSAEGNPRDLIGMGTDSMYEQAGLRIVNGVAKDKDNNTIDIRYYDSTYKDSKGKLIIDTGGDAQHNVNPLATKSFTDKRENKVVTVTEVDLAKLQKSTAAMSALNNPPAGRDPGIMYVNETNNTKSVRLVNGSSIPSAGLTVASNNPVYIKGDFNTANNPASVMGDAVMILSNSWDDAKSGTSNLSDRTATNTTVKACIMAGNVATPAQGSQAYSGGAENYLRLLENWSGYTLTYSGSLVCLWESNQATGAWVYGGQVYTAPTRNWSYGVDPAHLPPGTPRVRGINKFAWKHNIQ